MESICTTTPKQSGTTYNRAVYDFSSHSLIHESADSSSDYINTNETEMPIATANNTTNAMKQAVYGQIKSSTQVSQSQNSGSSSAILDHTPAVISNQSSKQPISFKQMKVNNLKDEVETLQRERNSFINQIADLKQLLKMASQEEDQRILYYKNKYEAMLAERNVLKKALDIERENGSHFDRMAAFWQENDVNVSNKSMVTTTKTTAPPPTMCCRKESEDEELQLLQGTQQPKLSMMSTKSSSIGDEKRDRFDSKDNSDRPSEPPREEEEEKPTTIIEINPFRGGFEGDEERRDMVEDAVKSGDFEGDAAAAASLQSLA